MWWEDRISEEMALGIVKRLVVYIWSFSSEYHSA